MATSNRSRPDAGLGSASGCGSRGWPSAAALSEAISTRPLGVGKIRSRNWIAGLGGNVHGRSCGKRAEVSVEVCALQQCGDDFGIALVQLGLGEVHGAGQTAEYLRLGSASPIGSTALTCAERVR